MENKFLHFFLFKAASQHQKDTNFRTLILGWINRKLTRNLGTMTHKATSVQEDKINPLFSRIWFSYNRIEFDPVYVKVKTSSEIVLEKKFPTQKTRSANF